MSFRLHLNSCRKGSATRTIVNPLTGEPMEIQGELGLSSNQRGAVQDLLKQHQAAQPDPEFYQTLSFVDGSIAKVGIGTLNDPHPCIAFTLECSDPTQELSTFIFELARRGNLAIESTTDPKLVVAPPIPAEACESHSHPSARIVETPDHLLTWLQEKIECGAIV